MGFRLLSRLSLGDTQYDLATLRGDILGGITAAVVSLPVALAFGLAVFGPEEGPAAGMYGAISVGFFAAVFGGTRALISGPTGSMTVAMAVIVASHADNIAEAFTIVIMAGLMQMLFGLLRIGRYVTYTPYSVISGFMSGVGVIIILVQILPFLGAPRRRRRTHRHPAQLLGRGRALRDQRRGHSRGDSCRRPDLAHEIRQVPAGDTGGAGRRDRHERAVAHRRAGHRRGGPPPCLPSTCLTFPPM